MLGGTYEAKGTIATVSRPEEGSTPDELGWDADPDYEAGDSGTESWHVRRNDCAGVWGLERRQTLDLGVSLDASLKSLEVQIQRSLSDNVFAIDIRQSLFPTAKRQNSRLGSGKRREGGRTAKACE